MSFDPILPPPSAPSPRAGRGTLPGPPEPRLQGLLEELARARDSLTAARSVTDLLLWGFDELDIGLALHEIRVGEDGAPADFRFVQINGAFERMTGRTRQELVGRTVLEVFPETDVAWIAIYGQVALQGDGARFEALSGRCGHILEVRALPTGPGKLALVFQDVTAVRELEQELAADRAATRQLAECMSDLIFVATTERVLYANLACVMSGGWTPEELEGRSAADLIAPEDRARHLEMWREAEQELGCCGRRPMELLAHDGDRRPMVLGLRRISWEGRPAMLHFGTVLPP